MFPRRKVTESNQKFGLVLDENHVVPPRQMSGPCHACENDKMRNDALCTWKGCMPGEMIPRAKL
jgi:hypothetical protein